MEKLINRVQICYSPFSVGTEGTEAFGRWVLPSGDPVGGMFTLHLLL